MTKPFGVLCLLLISLVTAVSVRLEARTWTSAQGQYKIEAEFVEHRSDGKVILRKPDGKIISVELTKLSQADQKYVDELKAAVNAGPDSVSGLLLASRQLLRDGRLAEANAKIGQASAQATSAENKQQVASIRDLASQLTQFWSAVTEAGSRLPGGAEMEIGKARVAVVEASSTRLVLRALGRNCRFALDRPETIPSSLALVLAKRKLVGGDAAKIIAAYESLEPEANNRRLWELAAGGPLVTTPLSDVGKGPPLVTQPTTTIPPSTTTTTPPTSTPLAPTPAFNDPQFGAPRKRESVPADTEFAKQQKEIRELFADEFKAATPKEEYDLAKKLFQLAQETLVDESSAAYVLYVESVDLAAGVGDAKGALQILDQINIAFDDPAITSREADVLATAIKVTDPSPTAQNIKLIGERASRLIDTAIAAEDFSAAKSAVDTAIVVARRIKDRTAQVRFQKRLKEIDEKQKAFAKIVAARATVAKDPNDAEANQTLAIYYCANQNDWDEGLIFLAKSSNQDVAQAAERDMEEPTDYQDCYDMAETWWSLGDEGELGSALKRRAAHWYEQALPGLSALKKVKAQKRIEEAEELSLASTASSGAAAKPVLLTSVPLAGSQGVDTSRRGDSLTGEVKINSKSFANGIWAQPQRDTTARIGYTLSKEYTSLSGVAGMDDSMPLSSAHSSVVFSIYNDKGKLLWSSAAMKRRGTGQAFKLNVQGVQTLYLVTQLSDSTNSYCYAVWGDLTLKK